MNTRARILAACAVALLAPLAAQAAGDAAAAASSGKAKKVVAQQCTQVTGSRIRVRDPARCDRPSMRPMRSYTADDLQSTGAIDLNEALRRLDPIFF